MPIDPGSEFRGSIQIDGKSDGKKCGGGGQSLVNQQLGRLVDDRVGVGFICFGVDLHRFFTYTKVSHVL